MRFICDRCRSTILTDVNVHGTAHTSVDEIDCPGSFQHYPATAEEQIASLRDILSAIESAMNEFGVNELCCTLTDQFQELVMKAELKRMQQMKQSEYTSAEVYDL
ncbi:hypothetical protein ACQ4M3_07645 [Leptolyngbya sp. AN03gr2]|uniref:hypothetical protein n=1 Tax=unclassified Leptolyngbya TaxID=2650499 RepID=UPI003D31DBF6